MKRFVMMLAMALTLSSTVPVIAEDALTPWDEGYEAEYVFSEAELREFLSKNIQEAVDKVTADLTKDHLIDKVLWKQQLDEQKGRADDLDKKLKVSGVKLVFSVSIAAVAGAGVGYLAGKLF